MLAGRCLPYGEGITYWPLAEMVKTVAGISDDDPIEEAFEKLKACCEDEAVADLLGLASGVLEALEGDRSPRRSPGRRARSSRSSPRRSPSSSSSRTSTGRRSRCSSWSSTSPTGCARRCSSSASPRRAARQPARLGRRPCPRDRDRAGGRSAASRASELVEALLADEIDGFEPDVRRALLEKTEGNPLFVEETIRMVLGTRRPRNRRADPRLAPGADRRPHRPAAAARTDRVLRRAAVIGRVFWARRDRVPVAGHRGRRRGDRRPAAPRLPSARVALVDQRRGRASASSTC